MQLNTRSYRTASWWCRTNCVLYQAVAVTSSNHSHPSPLSRLGITNAKVTAPPPHPPEPTAIRALLSAYRGWERSGRCLWLLRLRAPHHCDRRFPSSLHGVRSSTEGTARLSRPDEPHEATAGKLCRLAALGWSGRGPGWTEWGALCRCRSVRLA